jgi:hypothetical protein
MRSVAQLIILATAITLSSAQCDDGYENVTFATTPVQIRLAYQGPTAVMGKETHDTHGIVITKEFSQYPGTHLNSYQTQLFLMV